MKNQKRKNRIRAFSLIELSVIIIIVGIFAAGVFVADKMISKFRLKTAESLTQSSPIVGITQNALWLETTLRDSFNESEADDNKTISAWKDQSKSGEVKASVVKVGLGPIYSNTINRLHAVKFDVASLTNPSATNHLEIENASFLNGTDYTIFVLEKRQSSLADNYFIGDKAGSLNQTLALGYGGDSTVIHSQGDTNLYDSTVSAYSDSVDKPRLFVFVHSGTGGNKTYINGILAGEDATKTDHLSNIERLAIGKGYAGEIGEIAIFTKALTKADRVSVEDYLAKKWSRKNLRDVVSNSSCTSGIVTDSGCSMDCSVSSINGVTSPTTVADGQTNVNATCGATGYSGNITVSCLAGTGVITKSGNCPCDTANGYVASGDACVLASCSITGVSGLNDKTNLPYSATATAIPNTPTSACASGYLGSPTYTCTSTGAATIVDNCAAITCSITGVTGFNDKTNLPYAATATAIPNAPTTACASGYTGSPTYTCTSSGAANINSSQCVSPYLICTGGTKSCTVGTLPDCVGGKVVHTFTSSGTFSCSSGPTTNAMSYLMIGAGGNGGNGYTLGTTQHGGGGGGSGQFIYVASTSLKAADSVSVNVGTGLESNISGTLNGSAVNITAAKGANGGNASGGAGEAGGNAGGGGGAGGSTGGSGGAGVMGSGTSGGSGTSVHGGSGGGVVQSNNITGTATSYGAGATGGDRNLNCQGPAAAVKGRGGRGGNGNKSGGGTCLGQNGDPGVVIFSYPYAP